MEDGGGGGGVGPSVSPAVDGAPSVSLVEYAFSPAPAALPLSSEMGAAEINFCLFVPSSDLALVTESCLDFEATPQHRQYRII